jgi:hemerythrin-like metal-binding protein
LSEQTAANPALIVWKDQFATGMPGVDHEHKQLIDLINGVFRKMGTARGGELTPDLLGEIFARVSAHFALEEKVMREARYDEYAAHKADHELLLDQIRDIMDEASDDPSYNCAGKLGADLEQWFSVHFRTHDPRLHRHLGDH